MMFSEFVGAFRQRTAEDQTALRAFDASSGGAFPMMSSTGMVNFSDTSEAFRVGARTRSFDLDSASDTSQ